jgi:3-hydroxybutyryl-CoA dehydrogenase
VFIMAAHPHPHVVLVGAGRMGADMAMAFAHGGWQCSVVERDAVRRGEAAVYWEAETLRLGWSDALAELSCRAGLEDVERAQVGLVLEVIPEDLESKHRLLREIDRLAPAGAIIATNTSSLRITDIASVLADPGRAIGMHFGVPAHILPAVEVTRGAATRDDTLQTAVEWLERMHKAPIVVQRDVPGQIINRLQHAMYREIYHLIDEGIATPRDIDRAVRFGFGLKYAIVGPVASRDIHGLPVHLAVSRQLYPTLHNDPAPPKVLSKLVEDGTRAS